MTYYLPLQVEKENAAIKEIAIGKDYSKNLYC